MTARIFSTVVLWGSVIGVTYAFGELGAMWILALLAAVTLFETYSLLAHAGHVANNLSGLLAGSALVPLAYFIPGSGGDVLAVSAALAAAALVFLPGDLRGQYLRRLTPTFFGWLYVPFLLHYFVRILQLDEAAPAPGQLSFGLFFVLWVVAVAKFSDVGALLLGKLIGRTKMAPSISPGKTIEGLIGGLGASVGVGYLLPWAAQTHWTELVTFPEAGFSPAEAAWLALPVAIAAVLGDLVASVLKRLSNTKDSGAAIPGIGGALDLTDSLILAAPTGYLAYVFALS